MSNNFVTLLLFLRFIIIIIIISLIAYTDELSLKMIPIDSPDLQIVPNSLAVHERHQFLVNISVSRVLNLRNDFKNRLGPEEIGSQVYRFKSSYYVTQLALGDGSRVLHTPYLLLDTGCPETWMQCEGCNPCIELRGQNFRYRRSKSFRRMTPQDQMCYPPAFSFDGSCGYSLDYRTAHTTGLIGRDRFYFKNPRTGNSDTYPSLAFGCGLQNENFRFGANTGPENLISGIHGLGVGPRSFMVQLDDEINGRFSYCLPTSSTTRIAQSTVYFGDYAQISGDATRLVKTISMRTNRQYHLYLSGISLEGNRLPIDPSIFFLDEQYFTKGFFIDSGAPYSMLARSAYNPLKNALSQFFRNNYNWRPRGPSRTHAFDLCYSSYPSGQQRFPYVTLHFSRFGYSEEIDMFLGQDNVFESLGNNQGFCLAIVPVDDPGPCLLGAFQQKNFKFLYDFKQEFLQFVPEICE